MYTLQASLHHLPRFLIVAGGRPLLDTAVAAPIQYTCIPYTMPGTTPLNLFGGYGLWLYAGQG